MIDLFGGNGLNGSESILVGGSTEEGLTAVAAMNAYTACPASIFLLT